MKSIFYKITFLLFVAFESNCQTPYSTWELGFYGGDSYYLGEVNQIHFLPFNLSFGPRLRYNYDQRIGIEGLLTFAEISGNDATSSNSFKRGRNFSFESKLIEAAFVGEFNFMPYSVLDRKASLRTPFLFLGLGYTWHNPKTRINGALVSTKNLQIEGLSYKGNILSIPFGVGYKNRANKVGFEFIWGIRKTSSDFLDDVSTNFASISTTDNQTEGLNSTQYENISNIKRGDKYNKDWYVFTGLTIFINLTPEEVCRKI